MGNLQSFAKVSYESIQTILSNKTKTILMCTLDKENERYAIEKTIAIENEENYINNMIKSGTYDVIIILYGENMYDETIIKKYNQLKKLGFKNCYIYFGGLFEWLLLQDIYGVETFPTNNTPINGCLKFKPKCKNPILYY